MSGGAARPRVFLPKVSRGWRIWLATCALVAIAWPSAGTLPWLVLGPGDDSPAAAHLAAGSATHRQHGDADVPGSPTHPLDHDCAQCKVLKHLARCVVPAPIAPAVAPLAEAPVPVCAAAAPRYADFAAGRPPIRAPPSAQG